MKTIINAILVRLGLRGGTVDKALLSLSRSVQNLKVISDPKAAERDAAAAVVSKAHAEFERAEAVAGKIGALISA